MTSFPSAEWAIDVAKRANDDRGFRRSATAMDATALFEFGETAHAFNFVDGRVEEVHHAPRFVSWDVAVRAPLDTWETFLSASPPPFYNDLRSVWMHHDLTVEGDVLTAVRHWEALKRFVTHFDGKRTDPGAGSDTDPEATLGFSPFDHGDHETTTGRYVHLDYDGQRYRTYYEVAGEGPVPMVCLHTAGADSRQYRHLLEDDILRERFTVYAFDMPWHGRSYPPLADRWWDSAYSLTTDFYAGFVATFVRTLSLDRPVVMGCSMGGEIVLELAAGYADELEAVIGLETTEYVPAEETGYLADLLSYLTHPGVDQETFRPEWTYGLQAPASPEHNKRETWWVYSQAGKGVYAGDIDFYAREWDARDRVEEIDTDECGVYLLTGEYDFSGRPADTRRVAEAVDGARFEVMDDVGHFPILEDPTRFREYLLPVVEEVLAER
jgi:pimeloyl-ACP methyl ester carboxylesterase